MSCCGETTARVPDADLSRRSLFNGAALLASVIPAVRASRVRRRASRLSSPIAASFCAGWSENRSASIGQPTHRRPAQFMDWNVEPLGDDRPAGDSLSSTTLLSNEAMEASS
jgi:hypothetical protein